MGMHLLLMKIQKKNQKGIKKAQKPLKKSLENSFTQGKFKLFVSKKMACIIISIKTDEWCIKALFSWIFRVQNISKKSKSLSWTEQNYIVHFAMRYPVVVVPKVAVDPHVKTYTIAH